MVTLKLKKRRGVVSLVVSMYRYYPRTIRNVVTDTFRNTAILTVISIVRARAREKRRKRRALVGMSVRIGRNTRARLLFSPRVQR